MGKVGVPAGLGKLPKEERAENRQMGWEYSLGQQSSEEHAEKVSWHMQLPTRSWSTMQMVSAS
jgi:hypothetical protein